MTQLNKCKERKKECNNYWRKQSAFVYQCKKCDKRSYRSINNMIEKCPNTYAHCNNDLDKFLLLLRKGVYPYQYMDRWFRFNETQNAPFEKYYSKLNLSNISQENYVHSQKVWNEFKIKYLGEYHDLYVIIDVLL